MRCFLFLFHLASQIEKKISFEFKFQLAHYQSCLLVIHYDSRIQTECNSDVSWLHLGCEEYIKYEHEKKDLLKNRSTKSFIFFQLIRLEKECNIDGAQVHL